MKHTIVNVLLIGLIACLYFALSTPESSPTMSSNVIYKSGAREKIALECELTWNAAALSDILDVLKAHETNITFIVSADFAEANSETLYKIAREGHELIPLCENKDGDERLYTASDAIEKITGLAPKYCYVAAESACGAAKDAGLLTVSCTIDLLCARGDENDILERAKKRCVAGSIVHCTPTSAFAKSLDGLLALYSENDMDVTSLRGILNG